MLIHRVSVRQKRVVTIAVRIAREPEKRRTFNAAAGIRSVDSRRKGSSYSSSSSINVSKASTRRKARSFVINPVAPA